MQTTQPPRAMRSRHLVVVCAGLAQPSSTRLLADRIAAATTRRLTDAGIETTTTTIELRDQAQDLVNNLLTGFPSGRLREAIDAVVQADGLIAVTPVFSASYSGLFKLFFDVLERDALGGKPVLVAATAGTARHSLVLDHALRPLFAYLGAAVVPTGVFAAAEDWGDSGGDAVDGRLVDRIERAATDLANAVRAARPRTPHDPFAEPTPFEELLGGKAGPRMPGRD
jgi:FMN reductase